MTHDEMATTLKLHGWTVRPPPDLRVAGPWEREPCDPVWTRMWQDSTVYAARIKVEQRCMDCTKAERISHYHERTECDHTPAPSYEWTTQLVGMRMKAYRSQGRAPNLVDAQAGADAALLAKLERARKSRLKAINTDEDPTNTPLSLELKK
jgi:hypothetical protein